MAGIGIDEPHPSAVDKRVATEERETPDGPVHLQRVRIAGEGDTDLKVSGGRALVTEERGAAMLEALGSMAQQLAAVATQLQAVTLELAKKTEPANPQTVTGTIQVGSWPASFPLPTAQLEQLRAAPMPSVFPLPVSQFEALKPAPLPSSYPLPQTQLTALTPPALPDAYPLPEEQAGALAQDETLQGVVARLPALAGEWDYYTGVSGTVSVPDGERVVAIHVVAGSGPASVNVGGRGAIPVPATRPFSFEPKGNVEGPVSVALSGTESFVVEVLR